METSPDGPGRGAPEANPTHGNPRTRHTITPGLARQLRVWRLRGGYSQRRLAQTIGAGGGSYIANLEAGRRAPSVAAAIELAHALDLTADEESQLLDEAVEGAGWSSPWRNR